MSAVIFRLKLYLPDREEPLRYKGRRDVAALQDFIATSTEKKEVVKVTGFRQLLHCK